MPLPASTLIEQIKSYCALAGDTVVAGLPDGVTQGSFLIDSDDQILFWINEAIYRITRLCIPIFDTANVAISVSGQTQIGPYSTIISTAGRFLYVPSTVQIGGKNLQNATFGFQSGAANWYPPVPFSGNPSAWSANNTNILLSPYTTTPTLTVSGFFLPGALVSTSSDIDPNIDDFAVRTAVFYACWMIAMKNMDNSVLAPRAPGFFNEWTVSIKEINDRLIESDPSMSAYFGPGPIDSQIQAAKMLMERT